MKKKSILLTCIVAIMALAMFVGCDNAPELPSFVVNGNIEQTGDFLVGQVFDPGKFSVTVRYDNGKTAPADDTVLVQLVKATGNTEKGIVELGDSVVADLGIAYDTDVRTVTAAIQAYQIDHVEVVGPESYTDEVEFADIDKLGLSATAYYYGEDRTQLSSMPLSSGEWELMASGIEYVDGVEPSASNPEISAWIDVEALGQKNIGKYNFKVTFTPAASITADMIAEIESVSAKNEINLYAWEYENVPRPNFSDLSITVKLTDGDSVELVEDPGLILSFIKGNDGLPLTDNNLDGYEDVKFAVRAELGDLRAQSEVDAGAIYIKVNNVSVDIKAAVGNSYTWEMVEGTDLPAIDPEDFVVTYTVDGMTDYVPASDLELVYSTSGSSIAEPDNNTAPTAGSPLYVFAKYKGVVSNGRVSVGSTTAAPPVVPVLDSISAVVASGFDAPAKMVSYDTDDIPSDPGLNSVVVTANYTLGGESKNVPAKSVVYSTSATAIVKPTATSFNGETPIYLYVTYEEDSVTEHCAVEITDLLSEAYAEELKVTFGYSMVTADTASSAVAQQEPMAGATIEDFEVVAINDAGIVAVLDEDEYQFMLNGVFTTAIDPSTYVVGDEASATYDVTALLTVDATGKKDYVTLADAFTFKAGKGWIDFESVVDDLEFALASGYDNKVGAEISKDAEDYAVVAESYADAVHAGTGVAPTIEIYSVEIVDDGADASSAKGKYIEATGNSVIFTVKYTDETGEEQNVQLSDVWTFDGVSYVAITNDHFALQYRATEEDEYETITRLNSRTEYVFDNFRIDPSSYKKAGTVADPEFTIYYGDAETGNEINSDFTPAWSGSYTVVFSYDGLSEDAPYTSADLTDTITIERYAD